MLADLLFEYLPALLAALVLLPALVIQVLLFVERTGRPRNDRPRGKEPAARATHRHAARPARPFPSAGGFGPRRVSAAPRDDE